VVNGFRWAAVPLFVAPAIGCVDPVPAPDEQSAYVDLYLHDGIEVCGGQLDAYDRFIEHVFEFYADQSPIDFKVDVHAEEDPDCPAGQSCARSGSVWLGADLGQYHELTHIIQGRVDGGSILSLKEGTAEGLGPAIPISYRASELSDLEPDFLFAENTADLSYPHAAAFTRFMIERWDMKSYRDFFRAVGDLEAPGEVDYRREFESAFDEPFDESWSAFVSDRRCAYDFPVCDIRTPIVLPFELHGIDCSDPETIGYDSTALDLMPAEVPYRPAKTFHLDNPESRTVTFELEYVTIYLGGCGDCDQQEPSLVLSSSDDPDFPPIRFDLELQAGTTVFYVRARAGGITRVSITDAS
jgi:hypothetical protein